MDVSHDLSQKLDLMARRHAELSDLLGLAQTGANPTLFARLSKEYAELDPVVEAQRVLHDLEQQLQETMELLNNPDSDQEMQAMAQEELESLREQIVQQQRTIQLLLLPSDDPNWDQNPKRA